MSGIVLGTQECIQSKPIKGSSFCILGTLFIVQIDFEWRKTVAIELIDHSKTEREFMKSSYAKVFRPGTAKKCHHTRGLRIISEYEGIVGLS